MYSFLCFQKSKFSAEAIQLESSSFNSGLNFGNANMLSLVNYIVMTLNITCLFSESINNWPRRCLFYNQVIKKMCLYILNEPAADFVHVLHNRPILLAQCCTQFKFPWVMILCVLYLHYNVAFTFKWYGNSWNKTLYSQRVWIGYNIELAKYVYGHLRHC